VFFNGYAAGFVKGKIFTGGTKGFCVPVLNCYSCPGALGACPIGALQSLLGGGSRIPFYALGLLMLFGVVCGRLLCGFLCPFGFLQDLLHRIPVKKVQVPKRLDRPLRLVKYIVLVVLVVGLPLLATNTYGIGTPWFCKLLCPAGTLEGGIPLMVLNGSLRALAGTLFRWKVLVLLTVVIACLLIHRFFCRYLCPLGAIYSLFNRFALCRMKLDRTKCVSCGRCESACPMAVDVTRDINGPECIRCGKCAAVCPTDAISHDWPLHSHVESQKSKIHKQT
jgi:polyferredoxin